jgi:PAS domain S-box-containing protein
MATANRQPARQKMEAEVREMLLHIPAPAYVADQDTLHFTIVNQRFEELLGYTEAELQDMTIEQIRPAEDVPLLRQSVASEAPPGFVYWRYLRKSGQLLDVKIHYRDLPYVSDEGRQIRSRLIVVEFWQEGWLPAA